MSASPLNRHRPTAPENQILDFLAHLAQFRVNTPPDIEIAAHYLARYDDRWTPRMFGDWLRHHRIQRDPPPMTPPRWSGYGIERRIPFGPARSAGGKSPSIPETSSRRPSSPTILDEMTRQPAIDEILHTGSTTGTQPRPTQEPVYPADHIEGIVESCN
jgi:hypothetical protein